MIEIFGYVYQTTNLINNKCYIGKREGNFDKNYFGSGKILQRTLKKYSRKNFEIMVLCECYSLSDLNRTEIEYIASKNPEYNIANGGTGGNTLAYASAEAKIIAGQNRSIGQKKAYALLSGLQRSKWNKNISEAKKGKSNGRKGTVNSAESNKKRKESNIEAAKHRPASWYVNHKAADEKRSGKPLLKKRKKVMYNREIYKSVQHIMDHFNRSRTWFSTRVKKGEITYVK